MKKFSFSLDLKIVRQAKSFAETTYRYLSILGEKYRQALKMTLAIVLFLAFSIMHLPVAPCNFSSGLDSSWVSTLNWASQHDVQHGQDIVFTYGPLSWILWNQIPARQITVMIITFFLLLIFFFPFLYRMTMASAAAGTLFVFFSQTMNVWPSLFLYSAPLLLVISAFTIEKKWHSIAHFAMIVSLSACSYVKFMFFPATLCACIASDLYFLQKKRKPFNSIFFLLFLVPMWMLSGQHLGNLFPFFKYSFQLMSGYSEAMSLYHAFPQSVFIIAILLITLLILFIVKAKKELSNDKISQYLFVICPLLLLFITFKHAFVRHDPGHLFYGFMGMASISLVVLSFAVSRKSRHWMPILFIFIFFIFFQLERDRRLNTAAKIIKKYSFFPTMAGKWNHFEHLLNGKFEMTYRSRLASAAIFSDIPKDISVDIYPWDQSNVIASQLNYSPRFMFQSYSAYTPDLLRKNAMHVEREKSPDLILWQVLEIDDRFPPLMDGASWPAVLGKYAPAGHLAGHLKLSKNSAGKVLELNAKSSIQSKIDRKTILAFPDAEGKMVWFTMDIEYTLLGKLLNVFFRPPALMMKVVDQNGKESEYRMIPGMMKTPFLFSPLITDTEQFLKLYSAGQSTDFNIPREICIQSKLSIVSTMGTSWLERWLQRNSYQENIEIRYYTSSFPASCMVDEKQEKR